MPRRMVQLATPDPHEAAPKAGEVLEGRYRLEGTLGEGGVGWVYRARHLQLGSEVAIKMLQERFAASSMMRPRFTREARAMAALKHPHIVTITDFSLADGRPYIVMELLEGLSMREVLDEGPIAPERAREIVARVLDGLAYAHGQGFIHRDLKPDNIFLLDLPSDDAFPKILDFGFVKLTGHEDQPSMNAEVLTRSGIAFGTPAYMSPEQATGAPADARSDLYSLGIVLFEMLVGRRPYEGSLPEIVRQHLTAPVPTFAERGVSPRESEPLRAFLLQAMAKEPEHRFQSATDMKRALLALPADYLRIDASRPQGATVSTEAPTVAAVAPSRARPASERPAPKRSALKALATALVAATLIGGAAVLVALGASWTEDVVPDVPLESAATPAHLGEGESGEGSGDEGRSSNRGAGEPVPTLAAGDAIGEAEALPGEEVEAPSVLAPEEEAEDEQAAEEAAAEAEAIEETGAEESTAEERRNPWQTHRAVAWMTRARRQALAGRRLSGRTEDALKRFAQSHRGDSRPHLLLAQSYMNRGWHRSALQRYDLARRVDSNAPADPRMRQDLVLMAADSSVAESSADAVVRLYGDDATAVVDTELARERWDVAARARLRALRVRL